MKRFFICLLCLGSLLLVSAQNIGQRDKQNDNKDKVTDNELPRQKIWVGTFPHGQYMVGLGSIVSISKHVYVLDSSAVVSEVNVDTNGVGMVRFYYVEPITEGSNIKTVNTANDRFAEIADRAARRLGGNAAHMTKDNMVYKQYPTTSHARTVEFRLSTPAQLDALYNSVTTAWRSGVGRSFECS